MAVRSRVSKNKKHGSPAKEAVVPVSSAKFAEEEELISTAQRILRARHANLENTVSGNSTTLSKKQKRRKIRQQIYMLSCSSEGDHVSSSSRSSSNGNTEGFSLASGGQAHPRSVHSKEA